MTHRAVAARPIERVENPELTPFRAPVHELAVATRGDHAVIGVTHAGIVLAGVKLNRAGILRHVKQVSDAARAMKITDVQLANAAEIDAATLRLTIITCQDCGARFEREYAFGPPRMRCADCERLHERIRRRKYDADRWIPHARTAPPCGQCGGEIRWSGKGPVPSKCHACRGRIPKPRHCIECGVAIPNPRSRAQRCEMCRKERMRAYHTDYSREYYQARYSRAVRDRKQTT